MASKSYKLLFSFTLLLVLLMSVSSDARPHPKKPSGFDFLKDLQGCHQGEKKTGLHKLKSYLKHFGYLNYHHTKYESHSNDDEFDDLLEYAVRTYQLNSHLNPTGTLDADTVAEMVKPRCGVPDVVGNNGTSSNLGAAGFTFFPGRPRWGKTHLTYAFEPNTPTEAIQAVAQAFNKWQSQTHFTFSPAQSRADLMIGFQRGAHWDGASFDGRGGAIAHAFAPSRGIFHYDADDSFSVGSDPRAFDLETIALHEIGHLLGLGHSNDLNAIMYRSIGYGMVKGLHQDDINGIRALYNV